MEIMQDCAGKVTCQRNRKHGSQACTGSKYRDNTSNQFVRRDMQEQWAKCGAAPGNRYSNQDKQDQCRWKTCETGIDKYEHTSNQESTPECAHHSKALTIHTGKDRSDNRSK